MSLRPLPVHRVPRPRRPDEATVATMPRDGERVATRIVALLDAVLSGRCAATVLRPVSIDAGYRRFNRIRHLIVDASVGPTRLSMSSLIHTGSDRLELVAALSTSGLLGVTVQRIDRTWRMTDCELLQAPSARRRRRDTGTR